METIQLQYVSKSSISIQRLISLLEGTRLNITNIVSDGNPCLILYTHVCGSLLRLLYSEMTLNDHRFGCGNVLSFWLC